MVLIAFYKQVPASVAKGCLLLVACCLLNDGGRFGNVIGRGLFDSTPGGHVMVMEVNNTA
jgi:hypothetical protein